MVTTITVAMFQGEDREEHGSTGRELGKTVWMICSQKVPKCSVSKARKSISSEYPKDTLNTGRTWAPLNFGHCFFVLFGVVHCLAFFRFSWRFPVSFEVRFGRPSKPERFGRARSRFVPKTLAVYEHLWGLMSSHLFNLFKSSLTFLFISISRFFLHAIVF